jgi:3',5'-cyclic AMP phosphodiesterase CpdA
MPNPHVIMDADGQVAVISDLHKYSGVSNFSNDDRAKNRSANKARREEVFAAFRDADFVVFNGDIFDIQCTVDQQGKVEDAVNWLKERLGEAPQTQFHLVLGNHEAFVPFIDAMRTLETDPYYGSRFHFHEHFVQLGDSLFVHGDEILGVPNYLKAFSKKKKKGKGKRLRLESSEAYRRRNFSELSIWERKAYEWFNAVWHKAKNLWEGLDNIVQTLYHGLERSTIEGLNHAFAGSKHIFTGHTHDAYSAFYHGKEFHNTGAAIASRFATFRPLRFALVKGVSSHVQPLLERDRNEAHTRTPCCILPCSKKRVAVVSDLHLFGRTTHCSCDVQEDLNRAFDSADLIVLNGDIFDITFPILTTEHSMKAAIDWIRKLLERHQRKDIHFVLGNHEAVQPFIHTMLELEHWYAQQNGRPRFHFHEHFYQPNAKTLFLHGDEHVGRKHQKRHNYRPRAAQATWGEQILNKNGEGLAQYLVDKWHHPDRMGRKLLKSIEEMLDASGHDRDQLENVFMGHTHFPFIDRWMKKRRRGYWVTNTGSTTNPLRFTGCTFDMASDGSITVPQIISIHKNLGVVRIR